MSAPVPFQPGDRVTWTVLKKVGGKYDWHTYKNVTHTGVVEAVERQSVRVKIDGSGRVVALVPGVLRRISNPESPISNPQEPTP